MAVAILDAARNSMSFFMLLVVSMGLSVVSESLGKIMLRCQILAGAHFLFGSKLFLLVVGIHLLKEIFQYCTLSALSNYNSSRRPRSCF